LSTDGSSTGPILDTFEEGIVLNSARNSVPPFILGVRNGDPDLSVLCKPLVWLPAEARKCGRSNSGTSPPGVLVRSGAMNVHSNIPWNHHDSTEHLFQRCSQELFLRGIPQWFDILPRAIVNSREDESRTTEVVNMGAPPMEPDPPPKRNQQRVKYSDTVSRLRMDLGTWLKVNPSGEKCLREYQGRTKVMLFVPPRVHATYVTSVRYRSKIFHGKIER
jgi:hypothetical protein